MHASRLSLSTLSTSQTGPSEHSGHTHLRPYYLQAKDRLESPVTLSNHSLIPTCDAPIFITRLSHTTRPSHENRGRH